jgi:para-aminobenzoate synthetase/4-amino-4-deoxychorismate lyase
MLLASGWRDGLHATFFAPYEFGGAIVGAPVHVGDALPFHDGALRVLWFRTLRRLDAAGAAQWLAAGAQPGRRARST